MSVTRTTPTHLTVVFGDYASLEAVGVGPEFRRVTVELTEEQRNRLAYNAYGKEMVHTVLIEKLSDL